jgi:hypothetical protein
MQVKKFIVSIFVVVIAFSVGYGDTVGFIQTHSGNFFTKVTNFVASLNQSMTGKTIPDSNGQPTLPQPDAKSPKEAKTKPPVTNNQIPQKQEVKRSKYLEDLRERQKESQEEASAEGDQGLMDNSEEVDNPEGEPEELPPGFTDPYAQFRRPPGSPAGEQPSTFVTDDEGQNATDDSNPVEEITPDIEEINEVPPEEGIDN